MIDETENIKPIASWKKSFVTISIGQLVSLIGSSAVQFAMMWWLAIETASPLIMSLAGLAAFIPQMVLGPFAGVWIDRMKRKHVIIAADLFMGFGAATFAVIMRFVDVPVWSVCIILAVRGFGGVFHAPASQAVIPMLVPEDKIVMANSVGQFMMSGAMLLGPVVGALFYAAFPMWLILLTDLIGAIVASISVAIVKIPELPPQNQKIRMFHEMKEGLHVILKDKKLTVVLICMMLGLICFMPLNTYYTLMTSDYFKGSAMHGSIAEIAFAVGMLVSSLIIGRVGIRKNKLGFMRIMLILLGIDVLLCGLLPSSMFYFWFFAVLCMFMGAFINAYNIPFLSYLQETIPKEAHGRVFSITGSVMSFTMPLGLIISGPVTEVMGVPFWFFVSGVVIIITISLSFLFTARMKPAPSLTEWHERL